MEKGKVEKGQSRRFLEYMEESFLSLAGEQVFPGWGSVRPAACKQRGADGDVVVGGHLGHSDHETAEFLIFGEKRKGINKTSTLNS